MAVQQQQCHRFADDIAAADDDGARSGDRNALALEQLDHARRRARDERRAILYELPHVQRVEPVDVLVGPEHIEHSALGVGPHGVRQR